MRSAESAVAKITIGIDLGDRRSRVCMLGGQAKPVWEGWVATTQEGLGAWLGRQAPARVVMEAGTHSPWVSRLAEARGHEVIVANPSELHGPKRRKRRNDQLDAEKLARLGRADAALLYPIRHRGEQAQVDLALIQSRDALVRVRTQLIGHVRGSVKAVGYRLPGCDARAFGRRMAGELPEVLQAALEPVVREIAALTESIERYDRAVEQQAEEKYPETVRLREVKGVGALTALAYVLVLEDPRRFRRAREVGSYVGLVPRLDESGESQPQLRITKAGSELLRRYLVQAAHFILGPFGPDTDLRRWGLALAARGGRNAKKRAIIAVARKLSVLLLRLWVTGASYEPLRSERRTEDPRAVTQSA